jgi:hypothetical protein
MRVHGERLQKTADLIYIFLDETTKETRYFRTLETVFSVTKIDLKQ